MKPSNNNFVDLFVRAVEIVIEEESASVSILQRKLAIGYPMAARLVDTLEKNKIIGPYEGSKPRRILYTWSEWEKNRKQIVTKL